MRDRSARVRGLTNLATPDRDRVEGVGLESSELEPELVEHLCCDFFHELLDGFECERPLVLIKRL